MTNPNVEIDSERSRIRAALVNSGRYTIPQADQKLAASKLSVFLADQAASTPAGQAAFLTSAVTAARCFGEVSVHGRPDCPLLLPLPLGARSLADAATALGAKGIADPSPSRSVFIGPASDMNAKAVQAYWNGWTAGIAPGRNPSPLGRGDCVLAGVAAGALAVGQAFLAEQGDPRAGRTTQRFSLWHPDLGQPGAHDPGPELKDCYLPLELWLIGLGNLGQAYLWSLAMLPYPQPQRVLLFLQDDDLVRKENWGTSILVPRGRYGRLKTRVAEEWAEGCGFRARRIDRRLDKHLRRSDREPALALAGLDRMPSRRLLGLPGFEYLIDAGLGATAADYQKLRINVFDSAGDPARHFEGVEDQTMQVVQQLLKLPAYEDFARTNGDGQCGAAMLAERSVAVPFVSAFTGALAIAQTVRIASGHGYHAVLTGDLGDIGSVRTTQWQRPQRVNIATILSS